MAWRLIDADTSLADLAFDHAVILAAALSRIRNKVEYSTLPVQLLPGAFTLGDLQSVYQRILGRRLDKSAFRTRMAEADFVEPIAGEMRRASNRPAHFYRAKPGRGTTFFDRTIRPNDMTVIVALYGFIPCPFYPIEHQPRRHPPSGR